MNGKRSMVAEFTVDQILQAVRAHLAARNTLTLATSHQDQPWAATAFYVMRDLDLYVCQGKRARTLAHMLANPRTAFAVDDRRADAWLQGLGTASIVTAADERWAREALQQAAPEFTRHFTNPEYPVLVLRVSEWAFAHRSEGIYPRQHLLLQEGVWRFVS